MFTWIKKFKEKSLQKKIKRLIVDRQANHVSDEAIRSEIKLLNQLAKFYRSCRTSKDFPFALEMEENAYRNAAILGDAEAEFWLGQHLLQHAKAREQWQVDLALGNEFNEQQKNDLYRQAHAYLELSSQKNIASQRLLGLCYIHGWGVAIDRKKGFSLIVESINREDSWDKLPEIFSKIGLNKPEFLKELIKFRSSGQADSNN